MTRILSLCAVISGLFVSACNAETPLAQGPKSKISEATIAARKCGMIEIRNDPLDDENSMLLVGPSNPQLALNCTKRWIRQFAPETEIISEGSGNS